MELIELALSQGITSAIIVVIYLIIIRIIDLRKEKNNIKINTETLNSLNTISKYVLNVTENITNKDKEKCRVAIYNTIYTSNLKLIQFFQTTVIQNHLKTNKSAILKNIHTTILSQYYNIYSELNLYQINGSHVSEYFDKKWITETEESMIDIMFKDDFTNEFKITSYSNRVCLESEHYINYIINKINKI